MVKRSWGILVFFLCTFSGCTSNPSQADTASSMVKSGESGVNDFWNTGSSYGELIFHGVAGIYSKKEDSIQLALEDAARKVAIFNMVEGSLVSSMNIGGGFLDYSSETETSLKYDENYKSYVDALIFDPEKDVFQTNNAVFVRVRYKSSIPILIPPSSPSFMRDSKPTWVDHPPHVSGHVVGVGYGGRRASHKDTVIVSYENAIFSIITTMYGSAKEEAVAVRSSRTFNSQNNHEISAAGILNNFYVVDTWVDPANRAVWTLAVAKETR